MNRIPVKLLFCALALGLQVRDGAAAARVEDVYGSPFDLFAADGLTGWEAAGEAAFEVEAGTLSVRSAEGGAGRLVSQATYADFSMEFEMHVVAGCARIGVRTSAGGIDADARTGTFVSFAATAPARARGLFSRGRGGWLVAPDESSPQEASAGEPSWRRVRIECVGASIRTWIDDVPAADSIDASALEGHITLEVDDESEALLRNARLSWLGRSWWQPIFDGVSVAGWHEIGGADWTVEDGAFVGRQDADNPEHGHLVSDRSYEDFTVRVEYRAVRGNSGLYFHIAETGRGPGVRGFQAEIDAQRDAGGLYETGGRGWVAKPSAEDAASWFRPGAWNTMTVTAQGGHIAVDVNGSRSAELFDESGHKAGPFALQAHGGQDMEVEFRAVELLQSGDRRLQPESVRTTDSDHSWTPPKDEPYTEEEVAGWVERNKLMRRQIEIAGGNYPMPGIIYDPVFHGVVDKGDYTVEKVYLPTHHKYFLTGNIYRPKGEGPFAGVICPHGHWEDGRLSERSEGEAREFVESGEERYINAARYHLQARCVQLARMGCVVFMYDMVGYGDSDQISHQTGLNGVQAMLRMQNLFGFQSLNSFMALTVLYNDPTVDKARFGMTGGSGGGTQTFITSALEYRRMKVSVPAVMVSAAFQGGSRCENAPYLRYGTSNLEFAAMAAPRALALIGANDWTVDLMERGFPALKKHWENLGVGQKIDARVWPEFDHNYNVHSREMMYSFMNEHLGLGQEEPIVERDFEPIPPSELSVFDDEHPRPSQTPGHSESNIRDMVSTYLDKQLDLLFFREDFGRLVVFRNVISLALKVMLWTELPAPEGVEARVVSEGEGEGYREVKLVLGRSGEEQRIPAVHLIPKEWNGNLVVAMHESGKGHFFDHDGTVGEDAFVILDEGASLLAIDCLLTGELVDGQGPVALPVDEARHHIDPSYTWCYNKLLIAERVTDILTAVAYAKGIDGVRNVNLLGRGRAGPWAILARALTGEGEIGRVGADWSWKFADLDRLDHPDMLPGAVRYGDLDYFAASCAPGELALVDCSTAPEVAGKAYRSRGTPGSILTVSSQFPKLLLDWVAADPRPIPPVPQQNRGLPTFPDPWPPFEFGDLER